jgi:hypothetical protein
MNAILTHVLLSSTPMTTSLAGDLIHALCIVFNGRVTPFLND